MLMICAVFLIFNLLIDGTLFQVFYLGRDLKVMKNRIHHFEEKNSDLKKQISRFADPEFIEKEARERLDFAEEGDLIFIFPEDI